MDKVREDAMSQRDRQLHTEREKELITFPKQLNKEKRGGEIETELGVLLTLQNRLAPRC